MPPPSRPLSSHLPTRLLQNLASVTSFSLQRPYPVLWYPDDLVPRVCLQILSKRSVDDQMVKTELAALWSVRVPKAFIQEMPSCAERCYISHAKSASETAGKWLHALQIMA
ncbi:hypothetical protein CLCR_05275 [Cladophialophora carrionii]|uniref:Uncharacterized protein n=1 Tax=Cladophialophora carrionii TaxID=86049 RepID=A0A1C1CJK0_9EURO|nr:hypothetical protein CLCR_05275 [Cladophialophora carrionii]